MTEKRRQHFNKRKVAREIAGTRKSVFERFPLLFTVLGIFGLVSTLTGVQKLIEKSPFLYDNPVSLVVFGLVVLAFTGTLYKKLG